MTKFDAPNLSAANIRSIELRAHQIRSEAMHNMVRALGRKIAAVPHKISDLFHRPNHV